MTRNQWSIRKLAFIAIMAAAAWALMLFNFPLPFAPSFMKFDISELPALFAGLFLDPLSGFLVILIKILLKLLTQGTETALVGEAMNIAAASAFVLPAAFIYQRNRSKKGAVIGLIAATIFASIVAVFLNLWVAFPMYGRLYGLPMEKIVAMGTKVVPAVKDELTLMLYSILPFNLFKHAVTSLVTWLIYKRAGRVLQNLIGKREEA